MKHNDLVNIWIMNIAGVSISDVHEIVSICVLGLSGVYTIYKFIRGEKKK